MRQPVDEIDVILRQHDIVEVLMGMSHIEAEAEFLLLASYYSSFEPEKEE
jgi:hypothetical protein